MLTNYTKLKTWFRHLLRHPTRKQIRPNLQLPGPARGLKRGNNQSDVTKLTADVDPGTV